MQQADFDCCVPNIITHVKPIAVLFAVLQTYRAVVEDFKDKAGLPEEAILDVRGNHDAFDVPARCVTGSAADTAG